MTAPIAIDLRLREILARDVAELPMHFRFACYSGAHLLPALGLALWNNRVSRLEDATPGANAWDWGWDA